MKRKTKTSGYTAEQLDYLAKFNAGGAAALRRDHPNNSKLREAADVMDDWAARYQRMADAVRAEAKP